MPQWTLTQPTGQASKAPGLLIATSPAHVSFPNARPEFAAHEFLEQRQPLDDLTGDAATTSIPSGVGPVRPTSSISQQTGVPTFSAPLTMKTLSTTSSVGGASSATSATNVSSSVHTSSAATASSVGGGGGASSSSKASSKSTVTQSTTSSAATAGSSNAALAPSIGAGKAVALVCALAGLVVCGF